MLPRNNPQPQQHQPNPAPAPQHYAPPAQSLEAPGHPGQQPLAHWGATPQPGQPVAHGAPPAGYPQTPQGYTQPTGPATPGPVAYTNPAPTQAPGGGPNYQYGGQVHQGPPAAQPVQGQYVPPAQRPQHAGSFAALAMQNAKQQGKLSNQQGAAFFNLTNLGAFTLRVERVTEGNKRDGAMFWACEFLVLESSSAAIPVGSKAQYFRDYKYPEATASDIAKFVCNGFSLSEEEFLRLSGLEIRPDAMGNPIVYQIGPNRISNEEQILTGEVVKLVTNQYTSRVSKKPSCGFRWIPVPATNAA